jgi:Mg-chelatase subunit ChlD
MGKDPSVCLGTMLKNTRLRDAGGTAATMRTNESKARKALVKTLYKNASCIDLAFMVDATGSMQNYIAAVAKQCIAIADDVHRSCGSDRNLRVAFLAYRDYGDKPNVESLDFTSDLQTFKRFVEGVVATGEPNSTYSDVEMTVQR